MSQVEGSQNLSCAPCLAQINQLIQQTEYQINENRDEVDQIEAEATVLSKCSNPGMIQELTKQITNLQQQGSQMQEDVETMAATALAESLIAGGGLAGFQAELQAIKQKLNLDTPHMAEMNQLFAEINQIQTVVADPKKKLAAILQALEDFLHRSQKKRGAAILQTLVNTIQINLKN